MSNILYILTANDRDIYIAASENKQYIDRYIDLFHTFFESYSDFTIIIHDLDKGVDDIMTRVMDDQIMLHPFNNDGNLILTEREIKYYDEYFKRKYRDFKTSVFTLLWVRQCCSNPNVENDLTNTLKHFEDIRSYDSFRNMINPNVFVKMLTSPMIVRNIMSLEDELDERFRTLTSND